MGEHSCPHCGKQLSHPVTESTWLSPHEQHSEPLWEVVVDDPGSHGSWRSGMVGLLAIVAVLIAAVALLSDDRSSDEADEADAAGTADTERVNEAEPTGETAQSLSASATADRALEAAAAAEFESLLGGNRIAYMADGGVVVLDVSASPPATAPLAPGVAAANDLFFDLDGFNLLSEGHQTIGIRGAEGVEAFSLSSAGQLVRTEQSGFSVMGATSDGRDQIFIGTPGGFFVSQLDVPNGATHLKVPELGMLVLPPSGGTYLALADRYEPFSDGRVVAASASHHIEVSCDDELQCSTSHIDRETGESHALPEVLSGQNGSISLSPDGRWVLRTGSDDDQLYDVESGELTPLQTRARGPMTWAPDSSFVAWFAPDSRSPQLDVFSPLTGATSSLDLAELGGVDRVGDAVAVFR